MPQIWVKRVTHTMKTFTVEVEKGGDTIIDEVKSKIHAVEGFLPAEQRLLSAGKPHCLCDTDTLADCGVKFDGATPPVLYLVIWSYSLPGFVYWEHHVDMAERAGRSSREE